MKPEISQTLLKTLFDYDESTGIFTRIVTTSSRARAGDIAGFIDGDGYYLVTVRGIPYRTHRLAWLYVHGEMPNGMIDHINNRRTDNRISNLRVVSNAVNLRNRKGATKNNKLGVLGVSFNNRRKLFEACVHDGGKKVAVSFHATLQQAAEWYFHNKKLIHPEWDQAGYIGLIERVV